MLPAPSIPLGVRSVGALSRRCRTPLLTPLITLMMLALTLVGCSGSTTTILWTINFDYNSDTRATTVTVTANAPNVIHVFKGFTVTEYATNPTTGKLEKVGTTQTSATTMGTDGTVTKTFTLDANTDVVMINIKQDGLPTHTERKVVSH
jgi:hypothetical protein